MKTVIEMALEHAKRDEQHRTHAETRYWCRMYRNIAEDAVEALAKQPAQQEQVNACAELRRLEHNNEVLMNALWKACGDDEQVVKDTIESQGTLL